MIVLFTYSCNNRRRNVQFHADIHTHSTQTHARAIEGKVICKRIFKHASGNSTSGNKRIAKYAHCQITNDQKSGSVRFIIPVQYSVQLIYSI